jgi:hypothetical protein
MSRKKGALVFGVVVLAVAVAAGVGLAAGVTLPFSGDGNTINGCYATSGTLKVLTPKNTTCGAGETAIHWNQTGPTGATGPQGASGPQGAQGTGPASQSCPAGSYVTGFDSSGNITCSCPHTGYAFQIAAYDANTFQWWPSGQLTKHNTDNFACSVTVQPPNITGGSCNPTCDGDLNDSGRNGWSVVSSTGYPAGTTWNIQVNVPNCETLGGGGSVSGTLPSCPNTSDVGESGKSTDLATFTPN